MGRRRLFDISCFSFFIERGERREERGERREERGERREERSEMRDPQSGFYPFIFGLLGYTRNLYFQ